MKKIIISLISIIGFSGLTGCSLFDEDSVLIEEPIFEGLDGSCGFVGYDSVNGVINLPNIINPSNTEILGVIINDDEEMIYEIDDNNLVFIQGALFTDFVKIKIVYNIDSVSTVGENEYYSRIIINSYDELISLPRDIGKSIFIKTDIVIPNDGSFQPFVAKDDDTTVNIYGEYGYFVSIINETSESIILVDIISGSKSHLEVQGIDFDGDFTFKSSVINFVDSDISGDLRLLVNNDNLTMLEVNVAGELILE